MSSSEEAEEAARAPSAQTAQTAQAQIARTEEASPASSRSPSKDASAVCNLFLPFPAPSPRPTALNVPKLSRVLKPAGARSAVETQLFALLQHLHQLVSASPGRRVNAPRDTTEARKLDDCIDSWAAACELTITQSASKSGFLHVHADKTGYVPDVNVKLPFTKDNRSRLYLKNELGVWPTARMAALSAEAHIRLFKTMVDTMPKNEFLRAVRHVLPADICDKIDHVHKSYLMSDFRSETYDTAFLQRCINDRVTLHDDEVDILAKNMDLALLAKRTSQSGYDHVSLTKEGNFKARVRDGSHRYVGVWQSPKMASLVSAYWASELSINHPSSDSIKNSPAGRAGPSALSASSVHEGEVEVEVEVEVVDDDVCSTRVNSEDEGVVAQEDVDSGEVLDGSAKRARLCLADKSASSRDEDVDLEARAKTILDDLSRRRVSTKARIDELDAALVNVQQQVDALFSRRQALLQEKAVLQAKYEGMVRDGKCRVLAVLAALEADDYND